MGSEGFGNLAISLPSCFWNYGEFDPQRWDDVEKRGKLAEEIQGTLITRSNPFKTYLMQASIVRFSHRRFILLN